MALSPAIRGTAAMALAAAIWGLSALYYRLLADVPPIEILAHRTLWSALFFGLVLAGQGRLGDLAGILRSARARARLAAAGLLIAVNWFSFILSVQIGMTVEASLGYYLFPLVSVALGALALGERPNAVQWIAVALSGAAVAGLTWALGVAPWVSLVIAASFGLYGLLKKTLDAGPVVTVTAEVLILSPLAALWLALAHGWGLAGPGGQVAGQFGRDLQTSLLLVASGLMTGGPLILMSYASRRMTLTALGLVQYINPTLQFLVAVLILADPFSAAHGWAFVVIWAALALYSAEAIRQDRAARRAFSRSSTSPTT